MLGEIEIAPRRCGPGPGHAGEVRQRIEREVDLARRAAELVAAHALDEIGRQLALVHEFQERQVRIDARHDDVRRDLVAVLQDHAGGAAVLGEDAADRRFGANLDAVLARGGGNRVRHRAGAAAGQSPRSERAVDLAHVVVQQHVGRARRSHAEKRADDPRRRHRRLEHVGLEPLIEKIDRAHRQQLHLVQRDRGSACRGSACRSRAARAGRADRARSDRAAACRGSAWRSGPSRPSPCRIRRRPRRRAASDARSRGGSCSDR